MHYIKPLALLFLVTYAALILPANFPDRHAPFNIIDVIVAFQIRLQNPYYSHELRFLIWRA